MKKLLIIVLVILMLGLVACNPKEETDDTITIFVGLGNNQAYYTALGELIQEKLPDVKVKFVYQRTYDTTTAVRLEFQNNDLPADIVITASQTPDKYIMNSCLDYLKYSHITSYFSYEKISQCTSSDGGVYQLPFTSRLIGITYNKTLMEEKGWEVPTTFDEMVALKAECDKDGIKFSVTDGALTGHGFNWLLHLMGAQWISSADGTDWTERFIAGEADISEFATEAEYFKKWYEAGLFGDFHPTDYGVTSFNESRALFYFSIINDLYSYKNEDLGIDDTYASMPWISEDGTSNYFTMYDNMFLSLNKNLANDKDRLADCLAILKIMTTDDAVRIYTNVFKDGYIAVNNFKAFDGCMYSEYIDEVKAGFTQPWYYNYFDSNTIVTTGGTVNSYLAGDTSVTMDTILDAFEDTANAFANNAIVNRGIVFDETLSYRDVAKIIAITQGMSLQKQLDKAGINEVVNVSLMSYVKNVSDYVPFQNKLDIINSKFYKGDFQDVNIKAILPTQSAIPAAIKLTGAEIKNIINKGQDRHIDLKYDENYGPYPIVAMTKGGFELDDNTTYVVSASPALFTNDEYAQLARDGKILYDKTNFNELVKNKVLAENEDTYIEIIEPILLDYLANIGHVSSKKIGW